MSARSIVLLSGGLDSATALALCVDRGDECIPLAFDYSQRHLVELTSARRVAAHFGLMLRTTKLWAPVSPLTGGAEVPKHRSAAERSAGRAPTYVPARNTLFLAHAMALAESIGAASIVVGATAEDLAGYPDCRPAFFAAFGELTRAAGVAARIEAPLVACSKADVVREAVRLGVPLAATWSCYDPQPGPAVCGACDACLVRASGFAGAGIADPAVRS